MPSAAQVALPLAAVDDVIDGSRYRLGDADARRAIIDSGRLQLRAAGFAMLPGLITAETAALMSAEALAAVPAAHRRDRLLGAYHETPTPDMPADHPLRRRHPYCMHVVATDLLPPDGMIRRLYESADLTNIVADLLEEPGLYRCADPLLSCAATVMGEGDQHGWHFDSNDFVVTLLLQKPEKGGEFEFLPGIRSDDDQNFAGVAEVMDGTAPGLRRPEVTVGTLMLFRGKHALHRVAPVAGPHQRVIAIFSYDRQPGMMFSERTQLQAVGRTAVRA